MALDKSFATFKFASNVRCNIANLEVNQKEKQHATETEKEKRRLIKLLNKSK